MKLNSFAENLKKFREKNFYSMAQLAELYEFERAEVWAFEDGRTEPSLDVLIRLAEALEVSVDELVRGDIGEGSPFQRGLAVGDFVFENNFAENFKRIYKEFGSRTNFISVKLNISPISILSYQTGKYEPSLDMLVKLADFFNVTIDELVCTRRY